MEKKQSGIYRLIFIIVILTISTWFVSKHKNTLNTQTHIDALMHSSNTITQLSTAQLYEHLQSIIPSHDIDLIAKVIAQLAPSNAQKIIKKLIEETTILSAEEKIKIIFGCIALYTGKQNTQNDLLHLLCAYPLLQETNSLLVVLIKNKYNDILSIFSQWAKECNLWQSFVDHAFDIAITNNDYTTIETLLSKKIRVTEKKASQLLFSVIEHDKDSAFVPLLVKHAHADVNFTIQGKTLLITAVEHNNIKMLHELLEAGAVVDRIADNTTETALQIAMSRNYTFAEQLLREYGA